MNISCQKIHTDCRRMFGQCDSCWSSSVLLMHAICFGGCFIPRLARRCHKFECKNEPESVVQMNLPRWPKDKGKAKKETATWIDQFSVLFDIALFVRICLVLEF